MVNSLEIARSTKLSHDNVIKLIKESGFNYKKVITCDVDNNYAASIINGIEIDSPSKYYIFIYQQILCYDITVNDKRQMIYEWIGDLFEDPGKFYIDKALQQSGVKVDKNFKYIDIARSHNFIIDSIFDGDNSYSRILSKSDLSVKDSPSTGRFDGEIKGLIRVKYEIHRA